MFMTSQAIQWLSMLESKRHSLEQEKIDAEKNAVARDTLRENERHNRVYEEETRRHNAAMESETQRHNIIAESILPSQIILNETNAEHIGSETEFVESKKTGQDITNTLESAKIPYADLMAKYYSIKPATDVLVDLANVRKADAQVTGTKVNTVQTVVSTVSNVVAGVVGAASLVVSGRTSAVMKGVSNAAATVGGARPMFNLNYGGSSNEQNEQVDTVVSGAVDERRKEQEYYANQEKRERSAKQGKR